MKKIIFIAILLLLSGISADSFAQGAPASAPQVILTWKAGTYVPAGFAGKVMPTANSSITASAELVDGGKIVDISRQNVYWYMNNNFIAGGIGLRNVSFKAPQEAGGTIDLRAEFPNYSKGAQLKTVTIPIAVPEVVIEAPFPSGNFSSSPVNLAGKPYFFNTSAISKLDFSWNINGQTPSGAENPQNLNIKLDQNISLGTTLSVSLIVKNTLNEFERASKNIALTYSPQQ